MKVVYAESSFWKIKQEFQQRYEAKVVRAYEAVQKILDNLPDNITFVVQTDSIDAIPETGEGGYTKNSRLIILSIDSGLPYGEDEVIERVRGTVFHELNHAARYESGLWHKTFLDSCIMEGLATVFERDFAKSKPLWGKYDDEVKQWLQEILDNEVDFYEYMYKHSDGRRWIGYKVGTYLIDEAIKKSGKSVIELTKLECNQIKQLVGIEE